VAIADSIKAPRLSIPSAINFSRHPKFVIYFAVMEYGRNIQVSIVRDTHGIFSGMACSSISQSNQEDSLQVMQ
jgi:hypothetical protein